MLVGAWLGRSCLLEDGKLASYGFPEDYGPYNNQNVHNDNNKRQEDRALVVPRDSTTIGKL